MRVKVKEGCTGFISGRLVSCGEVLKIEENQFSSKWMEKLEEVKVEAKAETKKAK